jgi:hypothetical protein
MYVCIYSIVCMYVCMYNIACMTADTATTSLKTVIKKNSYDYKQYILLDAK